MSHTFTQLLYHVVFSTQYRAKLIGPQLQQELYPYIQANIRDKGGVPLAIGGMPDHVHLLIRLKPTASVSDLLCSVKANSSRWISERADLSREFAWQEGYSAFSVSKSGAQAVFRYIHHQEAHHRRRSFEEEWMGLLARHGIEFDRDRPFG
ncbi:MAG TPA: IS200/IS605 family transposase [Thermoanaerobaculia bacterium]